MARHLVLQPADADSDRARLAALEKKLAQRERELATARVELQQLQSRYLEEIGGFYAQLGALEAAVAEAEILAGLRPPPAQVDAAAEEDDAPDDSDEPSASCSNRSAPSDNLKRMFRDLAKAIHPDLAADDPARYRRHSLMAEANRAYAERDEDRLRLILGAWERSPESALDEGPEDDRHRVQRRVAAVDARLIAVEAAFADVRASAIWRLKGKIDEARAQGWDLFAEMILQVKREIARATHRLAYLGRSAGV
jgi:hypothetical protein